MTMQWRPFWRRVANVSSAMLVLLVFAHTAMVQPASPEGLAPFVNEGGRGAIPGEYNVVFKVGGSPRFRIEARETAGALEVARRQNLAIQEMVRRLGGIVHHSYDTAIVGFSAKLAPAALEAVRKTRGVAYVEPEIRYSGDTIQTINSGFPKRGIDRIDRRLLPLDNMYTYSETGNGVNVYVIDTGILAAHQEFQGRAFGLADFVLDGNGTGDCHGHGTHVAGIIGGRLSGVAKEVKLYALRALDCQKSALPGTVTAAINAAAAHAQQNSTVRAVVNMSLSGLGVSDTQRDAIIGAITNQKLIFVVSAGNNNGDTCGYSPARMPEVITTGAVDPENDTREPTSNFGMCVDLFAPGVKIYSAVIPNADDPMCLNDPTNVYCFTRTSYETGTSQAAPHVAGVAARYLQANPTKTPAEVWNAIHQANNVAGSSTVIGGVTKVWPGVIEPTTNAVIAGSPNEMLHYGSLDDGFNDGDPHITTVGGVRYDFQGAGEFVALREANGFEIQTRTAPVATAAMPLVDPYTGLANCVSINTAVAARVGTHRISFQPSINGEPDASRMQLRVDGRIADVGANGLYLDGGGSVTGTPGGGIDVSFPDGTDLLVTPGWWAEQRTWYLNLAVLRTTATEGIMGSPPAGSWLPALPDGSSVGPMPAALAERHVVLNEKFTDSWRVSNASSLFDYAPGTSSATFTRAPWPPADRNCGLPYAKPLQPLPATVAQSLCDPIGDQGRKASCMFDVAVTGEPGFAKTYLLTERTLRRSTRVTLHHDDKFVTAPGDPVILTALVERRMGARELIPKGAVRFLVDGKPVSDFVGLDASGRASWRTSRLPPGVHRLAAMFIPKGPELLPSSSLEVLHTVGKQQSLR